jgi:hypothetical protein
MGDYVGHREISELLPEIVNGIETDDSHAKNANPFDTNCEVRIVEIYLHTHPIEIPVAASHIHHNGVNSSRR